VLASAPPVDDTIPDEQGIGDSSVDEGIPLVDPTTQTTLPAGCVAPRAAIATFLGELVSADDGAAIYSVVQVRGGSLGAYVNAGAISIRYAERETRFLQVGTTYLVGAGGSELFSTLESKVRAKKQLFAGDAVVGVDESDKPCPVIEDPVLTLLPNGQPINAGVFSLLRNGRSGLVQAVVLPLLFALVFLVGLVITKRLFVGAETISKKPVSRRRVSSVKSVSPRKRSTRGTRGK
jgi:hypothetical protein